MKQYKSHKIVQAARIVSVQPPTPTAHDPFRAHWTFVLEDGTTVDVEGGQFAKAEAGGFLVAYNDGHRSYSPAAVFEDGYTEMAPFLGANESVDHAQLATLGNMLELAKPDPTKAPYVPVERIDALVASLTYESARVPNTTSTVATARLPGGFVVSIGHDACVSAANFKADLGKKYAIQAAALSAREKLWEFEGYALVRNLELAKKIQDLVDVQKAPGTIDDEYMRGLANGLLVALSVVDGSTPEMVKPTPRPAERLAAIEGRPAHEVRVFDEMWELDAKREKLRAFIDTAGTPGSIFDKLADAERVRLRRQLTVMAGYSDVLAKRIAAFDKPDRQFRR